MGRGAGNLNTELFIEYRDNEGRDYKQTPILKIIDEILNNIYKSKYWGYSLSHYISSMHNCHPNYAYLVEKATLSIEDINNILSMLDEENKVGYKKDLIEQIYTSYQAHNIDDTLLRDKLRIPAKSLRPAGTGQKLSS